MAGRPAQGDDHLGGAPPAAQGHCPLRGGRLRRHLPLPVGGAPAGPGRRHRPPCLRGVPLAAVGVQAGGPRPARG
eukprot:2131088-Heterocapsa_arctica.AAC.1